MLNDFDTMEHMFFFINQDTSEVEQSRVMYTCRICHQLRREQNEPDLSEQEDANDGTARDDG